MNDTSEMMTDTVEQMKEIIQIPRNYGKHWIWIKNWNLKKNDSSAHVIIALLINVYLLSGPTKEELEQIKLAEERELFRQKEEERILKEKLEMEEEAERKIREKEWVIFLRNHFIKSCIFSQIFIFI